MLYAVDNSFIWAQLVGLEFEHLQYAFWALSENVEYLVNYYMNRK